MLYTHWRDEEAELLTVNAAEKAASNAEIIKNNSKAFHHNSDVTEEALRNLVDEIDEDVNAEIDNDDDDAAAHRRDQNELAERMLPGDQPTNRATKRVEHFSVPKTVSDEKYHSLMQSLNEKQRRFVLNALHLLKTQKAPFHMFLSGGAGVGKSHAITAIVQSALRFYGEQVDRDHTKPPVIVAAFTGKAAFNVFGMTLHTAFRLPPTQSPECKDLDESTLTQLRAKLLGTKLIIIDEISMVSNIMLQHIDQRLRQVFRTNEEFGGLSVIVVGHLRQLRPICGAYPFEKRRGREAFDNYFWKKFQIFELDEIMRQQGELEFCKALNNMSEGMMDEDDIKLLRSRQISVAGKPPNKAIWLFKSNKECSNHNQKVHSELQSYGCESIAVDNIDSKFFQSPYLIKCYYAHYKTAITVL